MVATPVAVLELFNWWRLAAKLWATVTFEFGGIAVWLWLLMLIGVLVPGLLISSTASRQ